MIALAMGEGSDRPGSSQPLRSHLDVMVPASAAFPANWERYWHGRRTHLKIVGIEVVQAVQRFSFSDPTENNSVPLVARKRALVRVYIDSGLHDGLDSGFGKNALGDITGNLSYSLPNTNGFFSSAGPPINADEVVTARPRDHIDRNRLDDSLNFILPRESLAGTVQLAVDVYLKDAPWISHLGLSDHASTSVEFHERRFPRKLVHMLIHNAGDDPYGINPPTMNRYLDELWSVIARYPAPDESFFPLYHLDEAEYLEDGSTIQDVFASFEPILAHYDLDGFIFTGLVSPSLDGPVKGDDAGSRIVFDDADTFAHELAHAFGLEHPASAGMPPLDPRIPIDTDEPNLNLHTLELVPAGSAEIMSPIASSPVGWSTASWQILFDAFAP
jgi:hypothetical protein